MKSGPRESSSRPQRPTAALLLALGLLAACRSAVPPVGIPTTLPSLNVPHLNERALLLLVSDREIYEGFSVNQALEGDNVLRLELARVLGRIALGEGRVVLERLLADPEVEVRRAATFSLGELEDPWSRGVLLQAAAHEDGKTGRLAVEALSKLGTDLEAVLGALETLGENERRLRLLPTLFRFAKQDRTLLATRWLETPGTEQRAWAAYALARDGMEDAAPWLRDLLSDSDPWVRGWAARGLGGAGEGGDLELLRPLLEDPEEGPIVQALRAAARLIGAGRAAPPIDWKAPLIRLTEDSRPGVRITALEVSGAWLLDEDLARILVRRVEVGSPREQQVSLLALARAEDPRARDLVRRAAGSTDIQLRRRAAEAAGVLAQDALLVLLASDEHPAVRVAVLEAVLGFDDDSGAGLASAAFQDPSAAVRTVALGWLTEHPELPQGVVRRALAPTQDEDRGELEAGVVRALVALAKENRSEIVEIAEILDQLARRSEFPVRREAAKALTDLGLEAPAVGPANDSRRLAAYREIVQRTARERVVELVTSRGVIRLRLGCPQAPLTCLSFLQLAEQGFYDGLPFHRVVPDFVIQAGDPSGGGWGGPGYTLRDEINQIRYRAGVIGMAHSGADTAGSQFFITLSPQPHLDGAYTAFGWVESGWEVLFLIEQEDRILRIREVGAAAS